jgi:hypothetical protein
MFRRLTNIAKLVGVSAALAAGVGALAMAAPAWAQQSPSPPTPAAASQALQTAQQILDPQQPPTAGGLPGPDPSAALNGLAAAYSELGERARRLARGLLARPTDGSADRFGDGYPTAAPIATVGSPHFCFYWVSDPGYPDAPDLADQNGISDGDGVPDYVEALIGIAEHSYSVEVAPGPLGWAPPKPDAEGCGSDAAARSDIYLKQIGTDGLFGYESPDPGQGRSRSQYGYLVLDDDYAPEEFPGFADPTVPASVTFAHEFNHLLQQNYDSFQDLWMFESTAVWTEQKVFPQIDDFVNYVRAFASFPGAPLTSTYPPDRRKSLKIYGSAVFNHWLDSGGGAYGDDLIRRAWELSDQTRPRDYSLAAYDRAIQAAGGRSFSREFASFAAATAEWRTGLGNFPDHAEYPDVKRKRSLRRSTHDDFSLQHTAYRLFQITPGPANSKLRLRLHAEHGVRAAVGLVGRDGSPLDGQVTRKLKFLDQGGSATVSLSHPRRFERITAVVVNADGRVRGFRAGDWVYSKDGASFRARIAR